MNCTNCAAPLTFVEGNGHFDCQFCHTLHFPQEPNVSPDRITLLDAHSDERCPLCDEQLNLGVMEKLQVRTCRGCRGILIEQDDFAGLIGHRRASFDGAIVAPPPMDRDQLRRRIACPSCHARMDAYPYCGPGNVVIDGCFRCKLLWFDHGEVAAIERAPGKRW